LEHYALTSIGIEKKKLTNRRKKNMKNNGYLPTEGQDTDGALRPKSVILTERQIHEIEELVAEFRRGHFPNVSFSSFVRLAIEYGLGEAASKMTTFGGR
jgi:hypothetical protein